MLTAAYEQPAAYAGCARAEARVNMFVMATLDTVSTSNPVRIRNMSPGGAMIEGAVLPRPDTACRLLRQDRQVDGHVAWVAEGRAGLKFDKVARIGDWLPSAQRVQADVDATIVQARADRSAGSIQPAPKPVGPSEADAPEILRIADALEDLADALSDDPAVVMRYMAKLQTFDLAVQTLRKLARHAPGSI